MTILWGSGERNEYYNRFLGSGFGVELMPAKTIPYDENPTPMQEQIELLVTDGKGYLGLKDSLKLVNSKPYLPRVTFLDAIDRGLVPLYLNGLEDSPFPEIMIKNPCGEIPLGESSPVILPFPLTQPTLLEKLEMEQRIRWMEEERRKNPHVLFSG